MNYIGHLNKNDLCSSVGRSDFCLPGNVQTDSLGHPASYVVGTGFLSQSKVAGAEVKN
jgi:hypothetical protein